MEVNTRIQIGNSCLLRFGEYDWFKKRIKNTKHSFVHDSDTTSNFE